MENFSDRLEKVLEYLKISPYRLSKDIGASEAVISNLRNGKNKPSYELLNKILNFYEVLNAEWLLTGEGEMLKLPAKKDYTPTDYSGVSVVNDDPATYSPPSKNEKLHPKQAKKLHPTLHPTHKNVPPTVPPTHENCLICIEKERIIAGQLEIIQALRETIHLLRLRVRDLEDHLPDKGKKAG